VSLWEGLARTLSFYLDQITNDSREGECV
jgi:hypothetical protein